MSLDSLHQFFTLYIWFGLVLLLMFWGLIARTWQRLSGRRTHISLYLIPALLIGFVAVRSASHPFIALGLIEEVLVSVGGLTLLGLTLALYRKMLAREV